MTTFGKIEHMPIGATLEGVYNGCYGDNGIHADNIFDIANYDQSVKFKPQSIEVHDETITLVNRFGSRINSRIMAEINIKRGTMVIWRDGK